MASGVGLPPCEYSRHVCHRPRHGDYKYCAQHLLEDGKASFTSCDYISQTSKRKCPNPARRQKVSSSLPSFCDEHISDLQIKERYQKLKRKMKRKKKNAKHQLNARNELKRVKLVDQLMKYSDEPNAGPSTSQMYEEELNRNDSEEVEIHRPITEDWLLQSHDLKNNADWDDFDPVNNEVYEPLRYADVLTPEEVVATAQSKLIRLQSLYIEQFKRLFHLMKEKRRQYLHEKRKEDREVKAGKDSEIYATLDPSYDEDDIYFLSRYRKRSGIQELLRKKQKKRRLEAAAGTSTSSAEVSPSQPRCAHASNHVRCKGLCLPYTKFCNSHILNDPHQLLYKKCRVENCETPVCFLTALSCVAVQQDDGRDVEECYCIMHAPLPEMSLKLTLEKGEGSENKIETEGSEFHNANADARDSIGKPASGESILNKDVDMEVDVVFDPVEKSELKAPLVKTEVQPDFSSSQSSEADLTNVAKPEPMDTLAPEENKTVDVTLCQEKALQHTATGTMSSSSIMKSCSETEATLAENSPATLDSRQHSANTASAETDPASATVISKSSTNPIHQPTSPVQKHQPHSEHTVIQTPSNQMDPTGSAQQFSKDTPSDMRFQGVDESEGPSSIGTSADDASAPTGAENVPDVVSGPTKGQDVSATESAVSSSADEKKSPVLEMSDKMMKVEESSEKVASQEADVGACASVSHPAESTRDTALSTTSHSTPLVQSAQRSSSAPARSGGSMEKDGFNVNNNSSKEKVVSSDGRSVAVGVAERTATVLTPLPAPPPFRRQSSYPGRGERKPSSADEEAAVVSLLSLCSGHRSDDNSHSSSTEQD